MFLICVVIVTYAYMFFFNETLLLLHLLLGIWNDVLEECIFYSYI